jgi:hypothetical protein
MKPIKEMLNVATSLIFFFSTNQEFIPKLPSQGKLSCFGQLQQAMKITRKQKRLFNHVLISFVYHLKD